MDKKGRIYSISGPVVKVKGDYSFSMLEMVYVGNEKLIGEVIQIDSEETIVQVYEVTTGLKPGEEVHGTGRPLSLELGPGLIGNIFDGIQRPLKKVEEISGAFITRGINIPSLDREKKWNVKMTINEGDTIKGGQTIATVKESEIIEHKILSPVDINGEVVFVKEDGIYTVEEIICKVKDNKDEIISLNMVQRWPVRKPREFKNRIPINEPLITGQRVIDSLFPLAKGGTAAIPGGFGTGKTMTQHQLAKWADADVVIYIGCGERGNEITEVLEDFPKLVDPKSKKPLMDRTVLIANTSNMPVAAREASIYTGITIAEYYRDMGFNVAVMADSTSRWAEALREISGRLEEMPAEEGFPAYLSSRLSEFYERAGNVVTLDGTKGSVSIIGAVSPQGGDFSEPVTQNTKRFIRCFWGLDKQLAYTRHYPAINWIESYSEYIDDLDDWYFENIGEDFLEMRKKVLSILQEESKLLEIVKLIGQDVLPDEQKAVLEISKIIRQGFLQQNAFHDIDTYVSLEKQFKMLEAIMLLNEKTMFLVKKGVPISVIKETGLFEKLIRMKYDIGNEDLKPFDLLMDEIEKDFQKIGKENIAIERMR